MAVSKMSDVVVIGLGNPFMSDDGVGVEIIHRLAAQSSRFPDVEFLDLGSAVHGVLHVVSGKKRVILIDCGFMDAEPGTMRRFTLDEVITKKEVSGLSFHEADLFSILELSRRLNELPANTIIYAIQPQSVAFGDTMSPELIQQLPHYVERIMADLE